MDDIVNVESVGVWTDCVLLIQPNLKLCVWLWVYGWGRGVGRGRQGRERSYVYTRVVCAGELVVGPSYLRVSECILGWLWSCCSQVLSSEKPTCSSAPCEREGLQNSAEHSWMTAFLTDFELPIKDCGWDSLNLPHSLGSQIWLKNKGGAKANVEGTRLWPTLFFLSE